MGHQKVTVTRLYEVECSDCGVIDSQRRRSDADQVAVNHRARHRANDPLRAYTIARLSEETIAPPRADS